MAKGSTDISRNFGVYNVDYFSGAQVALYIGDTWVDEVTSCTFRVRNDRVPLYGYGDELFADVSKGQVLIQGEFTINFKEAGYLWLVLDRYQTLMNERPSLLPDIGSDTNHIEVARSGPNAAGLNSPFVGVAGGEATIDSSIESLVNNEDLSVNDRNGLLKSLASLSGFSSITRATAGQTGNVGSAENIFEKFENAVWGRPATELDAQHRRPDDPRLNPFDIYLTYGDFNGEDSNNHTVQRITDVHIIGSGRQIVIDGQPIQEAYSFIARNLV